MRNAGTPTGPLAVFRSLVEPHASLTSAQDRRQATLLSGVTLLFLVLVVATVWTAPFLVATGTGFLDDPIFQVGMGVAVAYVAAYIISRTAKWRYGAYLFVATAIVAPWVLIIIGRASVWQEGSPMFLLFSTLLSSLFLRPWVTACVAAVNLAGAVAYGVPPGGDEGTFAVEVIVLAVFPPLIVLSSLLRQRNLERIEAVLAERGLAEQRFHDLVESAPDAIVIVDRSGNIVLVNSQAEQVFGYVRGDLVGQPVEILVPERFRGKHPGYRDGYFAQPRRRPMGAGLDLLARRQDGTEFPVEISLSPFQTSTGTLAISVVRDVSQRKEGEAAARLAEQRAGEVHRLQELNALKTRLLNTTSHELNTPLTPIQLQLHLLRTGDQRRFGAQDKKAIEILERNFRRLAALVQNVLEVSRIQADKLVLHPATAHIDDLVREVVESYPVTPSAARTYMDLQGRTVQLDGPRIVQVLHNLVSNARKFTPRKGRIEVHTRTEATGILVEVEDTGPGVSSARVAQLFQPFSQVHDLMSTESGSGLGLYICKGIVEAHGGAMGYRPSDRNGALFWFRLPLKVVPLKSDRPDDAPGAPAPSSSAPPIRGGAGVIAMAALHYA